MNPRIETLVEKQLIGMKITMSFAQNKTTQIWQAFMPRRKEIAQTVGTDLYSLEVFQDDFFQDFNLQRKFEKWAAVEVKDFSVIPEGMESLTIPAGTYAVFPYKGKPSEVQPTYQFIYGKWVPASMYKLDNRPHFAVMGEKYKGEDPDSEEEIWIPIHKP